MRRNGRLGDHSLVSIDNSEPTLDHDFELVGHELCLPLDPTLQGIVCNLRDPDLLLPDVVRLVDGAVLGGADLLLRELVEELLSPFVDCKADLPHDRFLAGDPVDVLLCHFSRLLLLLP